MVKGVSSNSHRHHSMAPNNDRKIVLEHLSAHMKINELFREIGKQSAQETQKIVERTRKGIEESRKIRKDALKELQESKEARKKRQRSESPEEMKKRINKENSEFLERYRKDNAEVCNTQEYWDTYDELMKAKDWKALYRHIENNSAGSKGRCDKKKPDVTRHSKKPSKEHSKKPSKELRKESEKEPTNQPHQDSILPEPIANFFKWAGDLFVRFFDFIKAPLA